MTPEKARDMLAAAGADGFTAPEMCITPELIDHAPIMAEQIANMHYEYAVQVNERRNRDADWWYWKDNMRTQWFTDYEEAVNVAESIPESACIVRRLVSAPEVVE